MLTIGRTTLIAVVLNAVIIFGFHLSTEKVNTSSNGEIFYGDIKLYLKMTNETYTGTDDTVLEIVWKNLHNLENNTLINMWTSDPEISPDIPLESIVPMKETGHTFVRSPILPSFLESLPRLIDGNQTCLTYWIGIVVDGILLKTSCLEIRPGWMSRMKNQIADKRFSELVIPGLNAEASLSLVSNRVTSWPHLIMGFRYLELDVKYELIGSTDTFTLERNNITTPFEVYLKEIKEFLRQTKEVIFLEINLVPYSSFFEPNVFYSIQKLIYDTCKTNFVPRKYTSSFTYGDALKLDRRLIFYWYLPFVTKSLLVWDKVKTVDYSYLSSKDLDYEIYALTNDYHLKKTPYKIKHTGSSNESCREFGSTLLENLWLEVNIIAVSCSLMSQIVVRSMEANAKRKDKHLTIESRLASKLAKSIIPNSPIIETARYKPVNTSARVWMTLRAEVKDDLYRAIQVNWRATRISESNSIALFDEDPTDRNLELPKDIQIINTFPEALRAAENIWNATNFTDVGIEARNSDNNNLRALFIARPYTSLGHVTTSFTMKRPSVKTLNSGACLGFWVAFLDNTTVIYSECFKSSPRWMWDNRDLLANRTLRSLVLPGTHNSGMASVEDLTNILKNWIVCQDEEVIAQLLYGIRYLDLRISYYPNTKELLWINHAEVRWTPLRLVLEQVRAFSRLSKDPVIVDVHRTPVGFDRPEASSLLVALFEEVLGNHVIPSSVERNASLKNIWRTEKNIIISYGTLSMRQKYDWLWPPIYQAWADVQSVEDLREYLDKAIKYGKWHKYFWAAMGHLTGTVWDVLFTPSGIRRMADETGWNVTEWLRLKWKSNTNILTTDFFHTNNVISVAIELNLQSSKAKSAANDPPTEY